MNSYPWIINLIHKVRSVPCCFRPDSRASAIGEQALHFEAAHVSLLSTHPCPVQKNRRSKQGKEKDFLVSAFQPDCECERQRVLRPPYFPLGHFLCGIKHFAERGKCVGIPNGRTEEGGGFRHCGRRQNCEARAFPARAATEEIEGRGRLDISEQNFSSELSFGRCS